MGQNVRLKYVGSMMDTLGVNRDMFLFMVIFFFLKTYEPMSQTSEVILFQSSMPTKFYH